MLEGGRAVLVSDPLVGGAWRHLTEKEYPKVCEVGGCRVVYLPYFAPGFMEGSFAVDMGGVSWTVLGDAEADSLLELEYLLRDWQINCLLLELVQVITGFILSTLFLAKLRTLFIKYNATIVVDEVMTAGRTSDLLLYCMKLGFKADYITMGKWVMGGMVLKACTTHGPWLLPFPRVVVMRVATGNPCVSPATDSGLVGMKCLPGVVTPRALLSAAARPCLGNCR